MLLTSLFSALMLTTGVTQDAPRVSARLSSTSAAIGETIVYEVTVENASGDVDIGSPRFPSGLVMEGTQDFSEMHISFPGGRSVTRRREFALRASAPGRFMIPSVAVRLGNRTYRTNAVELTIAGARPPRSYESSDEAWLRATMHPETVYVGQQSTLLVEAGFSEELRVRLTRPPVFDIQPPSGFWVQDVPGGVQSRLRSVNGRVTEIQSLQKAYFPLTAGKFAFASARAVIDVREGFLFAPETREIRSASPRLVVLPLPESGRPPEFKGAVGRYAIRAYVEPDTVAAGEAAQVTIELSGSGNVKAAPQPTLPSIPGIEQFAPTEDATVSFAGSTVTGVKQFQWVIIPDPAGTVSIPTVSYAFFDPVARRYETVKTEPLSVHVRSSALAQEDIEASATALRAVREKPEPASLGWVRSRGFLAVQSIPLILMMTALALTVWRRRRPARPDALAALKKLRQSRDDYRLFLRELEALLRSTANTSVLDSPLKLRLDALIQRIEAQRFSPSAAQAAERESLAKEAEAILKEMKRAGDTEHRAALFALLLIAQQPGGGDFTRGVELYQQGQFAPAAQAFASAAARDSADVAAWSNLGNAYFRAGDRGRAIWAWAHASREAPRDAAIVRNLRTVGAVEVLRTRPPLLVRPQEWYLLAAIGWWAAGIIAATAIFRRHWLLLSWSLPAVAIATAALIIGIIGDGRRYAVALNDETRMYGDPTIHSPIVRRVQAGAGLDVLEERGEWLRVKTISEAEGWVEADAVGKL